MCLPTERRSALRFNALREERPVRACETVNLHDPVLKVWQEKAAGKRGGAIYRERETGAALSCLQYKSAGGNFNHFAGLVFKFSIIILLLALYPDGLYAECE